MIVVVMAVVVLRVVCVVAAVLVVLVLVLAVLVLLVVCWSWLWCWWWSCVVSCVPLLCVKLHGALRRAVDGLLLLLLSSLLFACVSLRCVFCCGCIV